MNHFRYAYPAVPIEEGINEATRYGIRYLDLGYERTEWFMTKTNRDLHLDMYLDERQEEE